MPYFFINSVEFGPLSHNSYMIAAAKYYHADYQAPSPGKGALLLLSTTLIYSYMHMVATNYITIYMQ